MQRIDELKLMIKEAIASYKLDYQPDELYEPIRYSLALGGKRIRPLMVLLGCDLFKGTLEKALPSVIAIEVFHNFTLVHDDIMDDAPLRRGNETVYIKWGVNRSILAGDTMFALACQVLSNSDSAQLGALLQLFAITAREVCEGQQLDLNFESSDQVSLGDYLEMIRLKTAVLLGCSLKMGAITSNASGEDTTQIYRFGQNLGMAFQIMDDLLDVFGDEMVFGKRTGGDILACKKTFLYLKACEVANTQTRIRLQTLYHNNTLDSIIKIKEVKNIYMHLRIREMAEDEILKYHHAALANLAQINSPDENKEDLKKLAELMISRNN